jgi:hypothetical protein
MEASSCYDARMKRSARRDHAPLDLPLHRRGQDPRSKGRAHLRGRCLAGRQRGDPVRRLRGRARCPHHLVRGQGQAHARRGAAARRRVGSVLAEVGVTGPAITFDAPAPPRTPSFRRGPREETGAPLKVRASPPRRNETLLTRLHAQRLPVNGKNAVGPVYPIERGNTVPRPPPRGGRGRRRGRCGVPRCQRRGRPTAPRRPASERRPRRMAPHAPMGSRWPVVRRTCRVTPPHG